MGLSGGEKVVSGNRGESPDSVNPLTRSTSEERGNRFIGRVILMQVAHPISLGTVGSSAL